MKKLAFTLFLLIQTLSFLVAQKPDSTQNPIEDEVYSQLQQNLDSISQLWYVKQSAKINEKIAPSSSGIAENPIEVSDSILKERLSKIPSIIPLTYNERVKAFINLYTNKRRNVAEVMLGLSTYYFPIFERILDVNQLPIELKYMTLIESALNPRAVSRAGATGIWQFMYATGKLYGLEINSYVDERRDPVKATYAAVEYLKDAYKLYGDWNLAIAAYNCGAGNVNKAIRRSGGKTDYWELYPYLPRETRGYVPSFISAVYFMNYYKEHGLTPREIDLPIHCDTIMIDQELHLKQVTDVLGISLEMLRDLNPQYRYDIIPAKTKSYPLNLPSQYVTRFLDLEDSIYNYNDTFYFNLKKPISISSSKSYKTRYTPPPPKDKVIVYYTIKQGDNLGYISSWFNVSVSRLKDWNNIWGTMIKAGQKLVIYVPKDKIEKYEKINDMTFAQKQRTVGVEVKTTSSQKKTTKTKKYTGKYTYYTVKRGDNPWSIAQKYPGVSAQNIIDINNISDSKGIKPGQKLKIPKYK